MEKIQKTFHLTVNLLRPGPAPLSPGQVRGHSRTNYTLSVTSAHHPHLFHPNAEKWSHLHLQMLHRPETHSSLKEPVSLRAVLGAGRKPTMMGSRARKVSDLTRVGDFLFIYPTPVHWVQGDLTCNT